ncbi:MAG: PilZ domain-containing protein [Pseudomonadota bacterium]
MPDKREIKATQFVKDIRSGMTTSQLMGKYRLSPRECQNLYGQIEEIIPDPGALYGRIPTEDEVQGGLSPKRLYPRHDIPMPLSVLDLKKMDDKGLVLDISAKGLKTQGIDTGPMTVVTLVIMADDLFDTGRIVLDAQCRWSRRQGLHGNRIAGFHIVDISHRNLNDLFRLIAKIEVINRRTIGSSSPEERSGASLSPAPAALRIAWVCPACDMPQTREYEECPQCGVIAAKYLAYLDSIKEQLRQSLEKAPCVTKKVSIPRDLWEEVETQNEDANQIVSEALDFYFRSRRMTSSATRLLT